MSITNTEGYFLKYTSLVKEGDLIEAFTQQDSVIKKLVESISEEKSLYAYAEEKWTLKEMLQHMIDTERIFTYRALAIARKDTATLPSFDENNYAFNSNANVRDWKNLVEEMYAVRLSTKMLFNSFNEEMLTTIGSFSSNKGDAKTLGFIMLGHVYHQVSIVEERYF